MKEENTDRMINVEHALSAFNEARIDWRADFHTLSSSQVETLVEIAREQGYRKPKSANGSTARYFFAAVARKLTREAFNRDR
jgi:hypothetical protein